MVKNKMSRFYGSLCTFIIVTGDWFGAAAALLGEQIAETVGAKRLLFTRRKLLSSEHLVAVLVRTGETLAVPRRILVRYSTFIDHLQNTRMQA